jgi:hypothetical protein
MCPGIHKLFSGIPNSFSESINEALWFIAVTPILNLPQRLQNLEKIDYEHYGNKRHSTAVQSLPAIQGLF